MLHQRYSNLCKNNLPVFALGEILIFVKFHEYIDFQPHGADMRILLIEAVNLVLATQDQAGPHATNLRFAWAAQMGLLWISSADSLHSRHLNACSRCAVGLWLGHRAEELRGLQLQGEARMLEGRHQSEARHIYLAAYPELKTKKAWLERFESEPIYAFSVKWARYMDNRRGMGWKITESFDL